MQRHEAELVWSLSCLGFLETWFRVWYKAGSGLVEGGFREAGTLGAWVHKAELSTLTLRESKALLILQADSSQTACLQSTTNTPQQRSLRRRRRSRILQKPRAGRRQLPNLRPSHAEAAGRHSTCLSRAGSESASTVKAFSYPITDIMLRYSQHMVLSATRVWIHELI